MKITHALWCAACGALALAIGGFSFGGWETGAGSRANAEEMLEARLVSICVAEAKAAGADQIQAFKDTGYSGRTKFLENAGWATMADEEKPDRSVLRKCGDKVRRL